MEKKCRRKILWLDSYVLGRLKISGNKLHTKIQTHMKWIFPGLLLDHPETFYLNGCSVNLICLALFEKVFTFMTQHEYRPLLKI